MRSKVGKSEIRQAEKDRIRDAFDNDSGVEYIPATISDSTQTAKTMRVGAYCRVSTLDEAQAGSFEIQCQHFRDMIMSKPNWVLVDIYADEGISGTSIHKRLGFQKMLDDAKAGKVDMIVTKGISRFGRNVADVANTLRLFADLDPPVEVYFEEQAVSTLDAKNDLLVSLFAAIAQFESQMKSESVRAGIIWRMQKGIYRFPVNNLLGYDRDHLGRIIILEDEAKIIRYIYGCCMDGQNAREIANALTEAGVPTPSGSSVWSPGTVLSILRNEKYCGDVVFQKSFTKDYLSHKSVKNTGQRPKYRRRGSHTPIIPPQDWKKVQDILVQTRVAAKQEIVPIEKQLYITRVKSGALQGFVVFDVRWTRSEVQEFWRKINNIKN